MVIHHWNKSLDDPSSWGWNWSCFDYTPENQQQTPLQMMRNQVRDLLTFQGAPIFRGKLLVLGRGMKKCVFFFVVMFPVMFWGQKPPKVPSLAPGWCKLHGRLATNGPKKFYISWWSLIWNFECYWKNMWVPIWWYPDISLEDIFLSLPRFHHRFDGGLIEVDFLRFFMKWPIS